VLRIAAGAFIGVVALAGCALAAGTLRWNRATARAVDRIASSPARKAESGASGAVSREELAALPAPVRRYFEFALAPGQQAILSARLRQDGVMRADGGAAWQRFTAIEHFSAGPKGFVWDARVEMLPLLPLLIRDGYVGGTGASEASLVGLFTVSKMGGTAEVTSSSLLRYLAELAWLPTALLPRAGVQWTPLDADHARATLTDATTTVTMDVEFGVRGEIVRVSAMRYREVHGTPVLTPWTGRFDGYTRMDGMMIPTSAEVGWAPPEGAYSAWRGPHRNSGLRVQPLARTSTCVPSFEGTLTPTARAIRTPATPRRRVGRGRNLALGGHSAQAGSRPVLVGPR
jgi:uncharacterized protein DUF6544